jgi:hypothetical protein
MEKQNEVKNSKLNKALLFVTDDVQVKEIKEAAKLARRSGSSIIRDGTRKECKKILNEL